MWIAIHALGLLYLINSALCQNPSSKANPECSAMHRAAESLKKGINVLLQTSSSCQVNPHCSGINCTWPSGGFFEVDLRHCKKPIKYHFHFTSHKHNVDEDHELGEGDSIKLYENNIATFKIKVSTLRRTGSTVSTQVNLETCSKLTSCLSKPLLPRQKFCVRMQNCPQYNASSSDYAPCQLKPPASSPTDVSTRTQHTRHGSSTRSSSHKHPTQRGSSGLSYSTSHPGGSAAPGVHGHRKGDKNGEEDGLSVPAIIAISGAGMFAVLIVVGVMVYWKKYHHRTRLRAAYYNDISMHDPLYEDFGPEVA